MERWQNRVAVIVGVTADIVMSIARNFVDAGLIVVGLAQGKKEMVEFRAILPAHLQARFHGIDCDVSDANSVNKAFDGIEQHLGGVDALINIAGTHSLGRTELVLKEIVKRVVHCTQRAFRSMQARNVSGDVMIVDNVYGRKPQKSPDSPTFGLSKLVKAAMDEVHRLECLCPHRGMRFASIFPNPVCLLADEESNDMVLSLQPNDITFFALSVLSLLPNLENVQPLRVQKLTGNVICRIWTIESTL